MHSYYWKQPPNSYSFSGYCWWGSLPSGELVPNSLPLNSKPIAGTHSVPAHSSLGSATHRKVRPANPSSLIWEMLALHKFWCTTVWHKSWSRSDSRKPKRGPLSCYQGGQGVISDYKMDLRAYLTIKNIKHLKWMQQSMNHYHSAMWQPMGK